MAVGRWTSHLQELAKEVRDYKASYPSCSRVPGTKPPPRRKNRDLALGFLLGDSEGAIGCH